MLESIIHGPLCRRNPTEASTAIERRRAKHIRPAGQPGHRLLVDRPGCPAAFWGCGAGKGEGVVLGGPCSGGRVRRWWPVSYPMRASKHYELCCSQHYENYRYIDKLFHNVEGRPRVQIFIMLCTTSRPGQSTRPVGPAGRPPVRSVGPAG